MGLEAALDWLSEQFQREHRLAVTFETDRQPKPLSQELGILLFQAVNELLVNIVKHARATRVKVSVAQKDGYLRVQVADDGVGFEVHQIQNRWQKFSGFGLFSIRARLEPFGGQLEVKSAPGAGTVVTLSAPLG